jgi:hypothetical protein
MIGTAEDADFGAAGQCIPASTARFPRRQKREAEAQLAPSVRETARNIQAKLRAIAGIAVIVALMAAGTAAAGAAEAPGQQRGVEGLANRSNGSDPEAGTTVIGSAQDQTIRVISASSTPGLEHVDLFGDSLGYQAEPYLDTFLAWTHNYMVSNYTYGGTATCDWLSTMAVAAAERPQAALLVFSGNAFTPCMDGVPLRSPRYYDLYTTYTKQAIGIFSAVGTHVFLVGTPVDESSAAGWDHLDDIYRQIAQSNPLTVTYEDAGASVETATGGFTWTLPCMSIEPSCGHDGTNVVRSPDGAHFCPNGISATRGVTGPCDEYSPGAFRFALAMVSAVTQYAYSTPGYK